MCTVIMADMVIFIVSSHRCSRATQRLVDVDFNSKAGAGTANGRIPKNPPQVEHTFASAQI